MGHMLNSKLSNYVRLPEGKGQRSTKNQRTSVCHFLISVQKNAISIQTYAPLLWVQWVVYVFPFLGYFFELKILESLSPAEAAQGRAMKKL